MKIYFFLFFFIVVRVFAFQPVLIKYKLGDWYNTRAGIQNFLVQLSTRTTIQVEKGVPEYDLTDERIFKHSLLFINGHVPITLSETEKKNLRLYLDSGGFVFANDDYGMDESFTNLINGLFEDSRLHPIPFDHPVYRVFYRFPKGIPKIHEHDGGPPEALGLWRKGRLVLFYSRNTDIMDGWDAPEVHGDSDKLREAAIRMGVNVVVYALSGEVENE